jgi:NAD(P)-dependent dehydrogenase (short-subunit alcohol dehydrogenase family)
MTERKIVLITGATDGIGKQTALELIQRGLHVIVHGRNAQRAKATQGELHDLTRSDYIEAISGDLGSLQEVRALAQQVTSKHSHLDVLLNNAGVFVKERELTPDGFELSMGVNHFGHFTLTHALLPVLRQSTQGRIINLSSIAHSRGNLDLSDLSFAKSFDAYQAYAASKLANILFTYALARRLNQTSITVNAVHPGVISTKLLTQGFGINGGGLAQGAATSVLLATDPALSKVTGKYFADRRESPSSQPSHNQELQEKFYALSCQLTGVAPL